MVCGTYHVDNIANHSEVSSVFQSQVDNNKNVHSDALSNAASSPERNSECSECSGCSQYTKCSGCDECTESKDANSTVQCAPDLNENLHCAVNGVNDGSTSVEYPERNDSGDLTSLLFSPMVSVL